MESNKNKKILIIGGHSTPAFAVIDYLIKNHKFSKENFVWVGERYNQTGNKNESAEFKTVNNQYKIKFYNLSTGKLIRHKNYELITRNIIETGKLGKGFFDAYRIINSEKPDLVLSFGGFLAVPVAVAANLKKIPIITHEQTITTGMANKIIAKIADKVMYSWEDINSKHENLNSKQKDDKYVYTGNPIRESIFKNSTNLTHGLDDSKKTILVMGGNQGSHVINQTIFDTLEELLKQYNVIHQTGNSSVTNDFTKAMDIKQNVLNPEVSINYLPFGYISSNEIGEMFAKSDLLISRSGANTITEILALKKRAILIPIPWASENEQQKNAELVKKTGLAEIIKQSELNTITLRKTIHEIIDKDLTSINIKDLINLDAAKTISQIVLEHL